MAEQSSTLTTFRALVMLLCVVLIPFAAVCGTSFPNVLKAIQSGRLPTLADFRGPSQAAKNNLSEAPPFVPSTAANAPTLNTSAGQSAPPFAVSPRAGVSESGVVAASYNAAVLPTDTGAAQLSTSFPHNRVGEDKDFPGDASRSLSPVAAGTENLVSLERGGVPSQPGMTGPQGPANGSQSPGGEQTTPDAQFKHVQQRLQELGATYYLLEAWGDQSDAFRFYCRMAIGGNPHVTKPFQCVESDPLKAMLSVLQQVEDWHKGGGQSSVGPGTAPQGMH